MAMITQIDLDTATILVRIDTNEENDDALEYVIRVTPELAVNIRTVNYVEFIYDYSLIGFDNMDDALYEANEMVTHLSNHLQCDHNIDDADEIAFIKEKFAYYSEWGIDRLEWIKRQTEAIAEELLAY